MTSLLIGEALALGLVSGPACVASCGPVLVPSLLAERSGIKQNSRFLVIFLGTRFLGYLLFAAVAWQLGNLFSLPPSLRVVVYGAIHFLLAVALLLYAHSVDRACSRTCASSELVTIGVSARPALPGAAVFGFLTGISLCPPFVAAGVRASQLGSMAAALLYFAMFFLGSSAWFVPFVSFGYVQRNEAVITVARMAMVLIAAYYGFLGIMILAGRHIYGY